MGPKRWGSEREVSAQRQGLGEELEVGTGGGAWVEGGGLGGAPFGGGDWEVELRGSGKGQSFGGEQG